MLMGVVSSDEFCTLVKNIKARDRQEIVVKKLFTLLDVDGTGSLAYRSVLTRNGVECERNLSYCSRFSRPF